MMRWIASALLLSLLGCGYTTPTTADEPRHVMVGACDECHVDRYEASRFGHTSVGFGRACADCHGYEGWAPNRAFDHAFWPRLDKHATAQCLECHTAALLEPPKATCVPCHDADRERAVPDHALMSAACEACHVTVGWSPSTFDHDQFFTLEGAHQRVACVGCHADGRYGGTPKTCVGCHAEDAVGIFPDHTNFPSDCEACHSQEAWRPGAFEHDQFFVLEGAHQRVSCIKCHVDERYEGTPRTCVGCHAEDALNIIPPHDNFSEACEECHSQESWRPWEVYHIFPVHHETNRRCEDCHNDAPDFSTYYCSNCHSRAEMAYEHGGMRRYSYNNQACFRCHPRGRE